MLGGMSSQLSPANHKRHLSKSLFSNVVPARKKNAGKGRMLKCIVVLKINNNIMIMFVYVWYHVPQRFKQQGFKRVSRMKNSNAEIATAMEKSLPQLKFPSDKLFSMQV